MNYHRIMLRYNNGNNNFAIDWHCFPTHIITEGVSGYKRNGRSCGKGFNGNIPSPIELYKKLDSFHMESCPDTLNTDGGHSINYDITIQKD